MPRAVARLVDLLVDLAARQPQPHLQSLRRQRSQRDLRLTFQLARHRLRLWTPLELNQSHSRAVLRRAAVLQSLRRQTSQRDLRLVVLPQQTPAMSRRQDR